MFMVLFVFAFIRNCTMHKRAPGTGSYPWRSCPLCRSTRATAPRMVRTLSVCISEA